MRLVSFDYFRGIAILFIVAGHAFGGWTIDTLPEKIIANIVTSGTTLFVFISGFFFHHIFYHHFDMKKFMVKKIHNVLLPYLILSSLGFCYFAFSAERFPFAELFLNGQPSSWLSYLQLYGNYLSTGRVMYAYWYIPFIMLIFLMSPLFIAYIERSFRFRLMVMIGWLFIAALFIHRPSLNLSPLHAVFYFAPIYLLGINCSIDRIRFQSFLENKALVLGLIVLSLSFIQSYFVGSIGSPSKPEMFSLAILDINIFQKIALCMCLLSLLQRIENKNIPALKLLASSSFAIFFLHTWLLHLVDQYQLFNVFTEIPQMILWLLITVSVIVINIGIAYLLKLIFKHKSRYIIGW